MTNITVQALLALAILGTPMATLAAETRPGQPSTTIQRPAGTETRLERRLEGRKDSWQRFEQPRPFYRDNSERVWKPTTGDIKLRRAGD